MVGRFAGLGPPFLGILADDLDRDTEGGDLDRLDVREVFDLRPQRERRRDGRLAMILGRDELDRGFRQHPVRGGRSAQLGQRKWSGDLLNKPHLALEEGGGPGHALGGEQGREQRVSRAAKANAQPFHIDSSPARVSRSAVPVVPAIPSAWTA